MSYELSIITINLNNAEGLRKTIESVVSQTYQDFEYIVIDGASTDNSVGIIKEYADRITYWVSEPDKGIYNAMNKGILKSTGEYCLFLNSGDWFIDENVVGDFYKYNFKEDFISGNVIIVEDGKTENWISPHKDDLNFSLFFEATLPHPATFIRRELFKMFGLYNENNKIVSDWEFFIRCLIIHNSSYNHFDRFVSFFDLNGISSQVEMKMIIEKEREFVFQKFFPRFIKSYKKINQEKDSLLEQEKFYREYLNLKNGKTAFIIRFLLFLKKLNHSH